MFHPRQGLLHEGLASPVDFPRDGQARAPEVAVDNVGGGPHSVEQRQQDDVPPPRAVGGEARVFGGGPVGFRSRRVGPGPVLSLTPLPLPLALAFSALLLGLAAAAGAGRRPVMGGVAPPTTTLRRHPRSCRTTAPTGRPGACLRLSSGRRPSFPSPPPSGPSCLSPPCTSWGGRGGRVGDYRVELSARGRLWLPLGSALGGGAAMARR